MANYQAYEVREGEVLSRVEALCRHLTSGGHFTETTPVTLAEAELFLSDAYYWLRGELVKNGYNTTVGSTLTDVLHVLSQIQGLDAACQVEFSMPVSDTGEPNERYKGMAARRDRLTNEYLRGDALERLGATRDRSRSEYLELTGRSVQRKRDVYTDSDVVQPRFPRGYGQHKGSGARSGSETNLADPSQQ